MMPRGGPKNRNWKIWRTTSASLWCSYEIYSELMGFYSALIGFYSELMGFYSDLIGFHSELMGFYSDLMGHE